MLSAKILSAMAANAPAAESDPYFSNVSLLLHCDGTNGSQSFVDSSGSQKTVAAVGNAQISTTNPKFGTGCALFDGSGDCLSISNPPTTLRDWYSTDFTLEMYVNPASFSGAYYNDGLSKPIPTLIGNCTQDTVTNYWSFGIASPTGQVKFFYYNGYPIHQNLSTEVVSLNVWNHLAFVKSGNSFKYFVNGIGSASQEISGTPQSSGTTPITIAASKSTYFNGLIDEVRITKGVARYSANFTPPTAPFPNQ